MFAPKAKASAEELRHTFTNEPQHRTSDRKSYPFGTPRCRICQASASVMQSSWRTKRKWLLQFEPASPPWIEPPMGWTASADPFASVTSYLCDGSAAIDNAERHGLDYEVIDRPRSGSLGLFSPREVRTRSTQLCGQLNPWLDRHPTPT
jgi:hypothetical protein